jgi:nucleotide-binding universal stress UspA family protein
MYEHVLVPTDGSDPAMAAAEEAIGIADRFGARIHAVYVVDTAALPATVDVGYVSETLEAAGEEATAAVVERAREAGVDVADPAVVYGSPHSAVLDYVADHGIDLVVMGTHGRSGIERYLLGSVTEKVVRTADVPVLTVRGGDGGDETGDA